MVTSRRRFIAGGIGFGAVFAAGGIAHAGGFASSAGLLDHYHDWLAAVERVASNDAQRVAVMHAYSRETIGRHFANIEVCEALVHADRRCDAARASRDRIEHLIAQTPANSWSDRWVKRQLVDAYPT